MVDQINIETQEDRNAVRKLQHVHENIDQTDSAGWQPAEHASPDFFGQDLDKKITTMATSYLQSRENLKQSLEAYAEWLEKVVRTFEVTEAEQQADINRNASVVDALDFKKEVRRREQSASQTGVKGAAGTITALVEDCHSTFLDFIAEQDKE